MPQGAKLSECGKDSREQRKYFILTVTNLEARSLSKAVDAGTKILYYLDAVLFNCYYGTKEVIQTNYLLKLFTELNIINNILFNLGFMWTDFVMILIATP